MAALVNGNVSLSVSVNVTVTLAKYAEWKAIPSITSYREAQAVLTTNGICNAYAQNAILRRVGGFLIHIRHP